MMNKSIETVLFVGPQRTGTSWLYEYFRLHPEVCVSEKIKETFFFDQHYERGVDWYLAHFNCDKADEKIRLEIGTTYFHHPLAPERIRDTFGQIPVVITLRDPLERIVSLFYHLKRYGHLAPDATLADSIREGSYIWKTSLYGTHLQRWQETFGTSHVRVFFQEDLDQRRNDFLQDLSRALGIYFFDPEGKMPEKINTAALPSNVLAGKIASAIARLLRRAGMYQLINRAKKAGLKDALLAGKKPESPSLEKYRELQHIAPTLLREIEMTEQLLQKDLPVWKERIRQILEN